MKILGKAAMVVGGVFLLLVMALSYISGPLDGEPFVVLDVYDKKKSFDSTEPLNVSSYDPRSPVIAIEPIRSAWPQNAGVPAPNVAAEGRETAKAGKAAGPEPVKFGQPRPVKRNAASYVLRSEKLAPVPVRALVEYTKFGPLPKISKDGRKPSDIYARPTSLASKPQPGEPARIAILVNGMGLSAVETHEAIEKLPAAISLAFGPYGSNLQGWVRRARERGHEVLLQIPLEPFDYPDNDPGPHTMLTGLPPEENIRRLQWLMARFTGYTGLTNSMGEKFMTAGEAIRPLWKELNSRGLLYFDTAASPRSAADKIAGEVGLAFGTVEITIDRERTIEDIDKALEKLEAMAIERGFSVGVASGLPITIRRIAKWAKTLAKKGVVLVPISAAVRARRQI